MRFVVWFLLLFIVAIVAAATLGTNDGLVSIYWGGWRTDLSLNLFLLGLIASCFALVASIQAAGGLLGLPQRARAWRNARRDRLSQAALRESLALYFGGRYGRAQRQAARALQIQNETLDAPRDDEFSKLGHLLVAGSLHRLQDRAGRDEALALAMQLGDRSAAVRPADEGARLLAAEWAIDDRDAERALTLLSELPAGLSRRTQALRLRLQAARLAGQPQDALKTARLLAKHQAFSETAARGLLRALAFETLDTARDADQLRRLWQQLDSVERREPMIAAHAAQRAAALGVPEEAREWLRPHWERLAQMPSDERACIALALAAAAGGIGPEWLPRLEGAVLAFSREPAIAYAVGVALAERRLWGKARRLLEQAGAEGSLGPAPRRKAWLLLADLAAQDGDTDRRANCLEAAARVP